ncbi:MAG: lycopene cyclase domain-containing protein [Bacteroidota bacterium]
MKWEYMAVLGAVLLFPLLLSRDPSLGLWKKPGLLARAILGVCVPFWIWDAAATLRGHWSFNPSYVLGPAAAGLPLEEWLFFPVIAFVSIFTWEAARELARRRR